MKKVFAIALSMSIALSVAAAAQAAEVKVNAGCEKVNVTASSAGKAVKCTKKSGKLVWVAYTTKGSSSDQVPMGAWFKTGDWSVRVTGINDNMSEFICSQNMFNDGCDVNDDYEGVPDTSVNSRWVEIVLSVKNLTKKDASPSFGDMGFLNQGKVTWQGLFQPVVDEDPDSMTLLPGASSEAKYYVFLKNGLATTTFAIKPQLFYDKAYYFKTK